MLAVTTGLLEWCGGVVQAHAMLFSRSRRHEHGRAILEGAGHARNTCVVGQARVAVTRGQSWVEEGLLGAVVGLWLRLALTLALCLRGLSCLGSMSC